MRLVWLILLAALLAGCGSGGGSTAGSTVPAPAPGTGTGAGTGTVGFSTQAASNATVLYAVQFTLHLPAGVTLPADAASGEVPAGLLHPVDTAALAGARFLPASGSTPASVRVNIADPGGFAVGNLATLTCSVAAGATAGVSGFSLDEFLAKDENGVVISGITPHFTVSTP